MIITERDERIKRVYEDIVEGEIDLQPDFQRGEVWGVSRKRLLVDSIFRGWHIPPIHLVTLDDGRFEVLDGQQRLSSIRDFIENSFSIDGNIDPRDDYIASLNGKKYRDLDQETKKIFDRYLIKLNEISSYNHGEPNELFHRLNQSVKLTSSEARHSIYGTLRDNISSIVLYMQEKEIDRDILGFSNSRMAYNDMLSRVIVFIENASLRAKVSDSALNSRYRLEENVSVEIVEALKYSIDIFNDIKSCLNEYEVKPMLTKASSINWMYIFSNVYLNSNANDYDYDQDLVQCFYDLEIARSCVKNNIDIPEWIIERVAIPDDIFRGIIQVYIERSSSRVMSIGSILVRDIIQSIILYKGNVNSIFSENEMCRLDEILSDLNSNISPKKVIEEAVTIWRSLDETC
tara:strand:+ start:21650 stop:22858 length:1209 start_codon:yes stop_codon:yes gene_type:complete